MLQVVGNCLIPFVGHAGCEAELDVSSSASDRDICVVRIRDVLDERELLAEMIVGKRQRYTLIYFGFRRVDCGKLCKFFFNFKMAS